MTSEEEQETRVRRLERRLNSLSIVGAHGVLVAGHFEQGFSVDVRRKAGTIGACCVGSECFEATQQQCSTLGGSYFGDGVPCEPSPCPTVGACCIDGVCSIRTEVSCVNAGGDYQGDGTDCDPNPCEQPTGACCFDDGTCEVKTEDQCTDAGGIYQGDDTICDPNPCPQKGACCVGNDCTIETEDDCDGMGGTYQGDGSTCDPNPCGMCNCDGFPGFMGSGFHYLTRDTVKTVSTVCHCCRIDQCSFPECVGVWTVHEEYNPVTCEYSSFETGRFGHCAACKYPQDPCCEIPFPPCEEAGECSDDGDCGNPSFDFDMNVVSTLCFGAGGYCSPDPDTDSHESCVTGSRFCYDCGPPPTGDCNCTCGEGSDVVFTVDVTLSNPCIPS